MLIDTHCHLNFATFANDLDDVVRRAKEQGVGKIIIPSTDLASSKRAVEIAQTYDSCFAAIGIHPHHAQDSDFTVTDDLRYQLDQLLQQDRVVAVGEIGLDYYRYTKTKYENNLITDEIKLKQKQLLELQLDLAVIHNKPLIFHCRNAHADMIQTISTFAKSMTYRSTFSHGNSRNSLSPTTIAKTKYIPTQGWSASGGKPYQLRGVWHCFGGNAKQLQDVITMRYYVGFDGNITYNQAQYSPLVAAAPLNRILLETDAPFLTPVPHRGTRNEPSYLPLIAQAVAEYHGASLPTEAQQSWAKEGLSEVIHLSTKNAGALFSLP